MHLAAEQHSSITELVFCTGSHLQMQIDTFVSYGRFSNLRHSLPLAVL